MANSVVSEQCFAQGGKVLGRTREFLKEPDKFRDGKFQKQPETRDVYAGPGARDVAPEAKDKSLKAIKPRGV